MDGLLITCVSYALQCTHLRQHTVRKSIGLHFVFSACAERCALHAYARTSLLFLLMSSPQVREGAEHCASRLLDVMFPKLLSLLHL